MNTSSNKRMRNLGLAGGSLWLISAGITAAAWALLSIRSIVATSILAGISVAAAALIFSGIGLIRKLVRAPYETTAAPERKSILRQFLIIFAAEIVALGGVNIACVLAHHWRYIVPLDLIIVGLHFLPLARLFQVPRYNITGFLFCVIPLGTMLTTGHAARVGDGSIWIVIPSIGCALVAMATGMAGLNEARESVNGALQT